MLRKSEAGAVNTPTKDLNAFQLQSKSINTPVNLSSLVFSSLRQSWVHQNTNLCHGVEGLSISNNIADIVNDLNIEAGAAVLPIGVRAVGYLTTTLTKRLDAVWSEGNNQGGRFTGVTLSNTTYHVFLIKNITTEVVDVGFDTSLNAVNRPSGWSARRIGSIIRASNAIVQFTHFGEYFSLKTVAVDVGGVEVPITATNYTMTVPSGISVLVHGVLVPGCAAWSNFLTLSVQSPNQNTQPPVSASFLGDFRGSGCAYSDPGSTTLFGQTSLMHVLSNTSRQLKFTRSGTYIGTYAYTTWLTLGWTDINLQYGG